MWLGTEGGGWDAPGSEASWKLEPLDVLEALSPVGGGTQEVTLRALSNQYGCLRVWGLGFGVEKGFDHAA